jgi:hypothetical protein
LEKSRKCGGVGKSKAKEYMHWKHPSIVQVKRSLLKIAKYGGIAVGSLVLVCMLALLIFSGTLVNRYLKPRITKAVAEAYPTYTLHLSDMHYSFFTNRFGFDSIAVSSGDGTFSSHVGTFSVSGISWLHLLWGGSLEPQDFARSELDAHSFVLKLPQSQYEFRCERLSVSAAGSKLVAESLNLHPLAGDEDFFRGSRFRRTRVSLATPRCSVTGLGCLDLLLGKKYSARTVEIHDATLDMLVNKDLPDSRDTTGPLMLNEILTSIKPALQVDRVSIVNSRLTYGERFVLGAKPALVTFDSMQVLAERIANHGHSDTALAIHAQARFANAGTMKLVITIPVISRELSFRYSGSLSGMELSALNSFLEVSDHMRIKSGVLQEATYEVNVVSGRADGTIQGVYTNLALAAINEKTGSEKGILNRITSFIGNKFTIRQNNVAGSMKIGQIKYTRVPDDPFFQYMWFAIRVGVRDVIGL